MKSKVIKYPPLINEQALYVGGLRDITNAYMNELHPQYKRGNLQVDQLGCKCEMIAQYHFWNNQLQYDADQMLGGKPIASYDISVLTMQIDVKGIWPHQTELRVNHDAHNKDKDVSHYMFIQPHSPDLSNDKATYWLYTKKDIDNWDLVELKYSKAYTKQL